MPLPDERPRQSVANLIGRFEQQTKRQSTGSPPQRLSGFGVASHSTGDSARDEAPLRDRRAEWPPKPTSSPDDKPPPYTSYWSRSSNIQVALAAAATSLPAPGSTVAEKLPNVPLTADLPATATPDQAPTTTNAPEPQVPPSDQPAADPSSESTTTITPTTTKPNPKPSPRTPVAAVKASSTTTPRSSLSPKAPSTVPKSTSRTATSLGTPPQPLRAQLTGHSSASRPNRTPSRSATASASKTTPSPSSAIPQRPKTPSSGLFAPTAASLARSRNAAPPPPPAVRKVTLSSAAADRLSKPTAASMSKVRQLVATTTTTGTTSTTTTIPPKKALPKTGSPSHARVGASRVNASAASTAHQAAPSDQGETDTGPVQLENGRHMDASGDAAQETQLAELNGDDGRVGVQEDGAKATVARDDFLLHKLDGDDQPAPEPDVHVGPESHEDSSATAHEPSQPPHDAQTDRPPTTDPEPAKDDLPLEPSLPSALIDDTPQETQDTDTIKPELSHSITSHVQDDIVGMVNMLESAPTGRRLSIASIPDEVHEIPDEE